MCADCVHLRSRAQNGHNQFVTLSLSNLEHKCRSLVVMVFPPSSHAREFRGKLLAGWWCGFALSNQFSMGGELVNELELQMSESHLAENQPSNEIEIRPTDPLSLPSPCSIYFSSQSGNYCRGFSALVGFLRSVGCRLSIWFLRRRGRKGGGFISGTEDD